jgi:3D (Asp-Asp-Asp) domain-containing protein
MSFIRYVIVLFFIITVFSCKEEEQWVSMEVTASAYNSTIAQTDGSPNITAWGDTLQPTTKSIAVSRDLIKKGLTHNTKVKIEGFEGIYVVNDKMHSKWRNKIDIYFGTDVNAARQWGRKKVEIRFLCK